MYTLHKDTKNDTSTHYQGKKFNEMTEHEILKLLPDGRYRLLNVNIRKGIPKLR